jgi:hypothetical protein
VVNEEQPQYLLNRQGPLSSLKTVGSYIFLTISANSSAV